MIGIEFIVSLVSFTYLFFFLNFKVIVTEKEIFHSLVPPQTEIVRLAKAGNLKFFLGCQHGHSCPMHLLARSWSRSGVVRTQGNQCYARCYAWCYASPYLTLP